MITLTAAHNEYKGDKKAYVARITGRDSKFTFAREFVSKGGRDRTDATADVDTPGLYELRSVDKKGRTDDSYALIVETGPDGLTEFACDKADAMKIAKELDAGRPFGEVVGAVQSAAGKIAAQGMRIEASRGKDPEGLVTLEGAVGPWAAGTQVRRADLIAWREAEVARLRTAPAAADLTWGWEFRTAAETKKAAAAGTIDAAVVQCRAVLAGLPSDAVKKVLAALKTGVAAGATA